jgi:hypothetical protein
MTGPTIDPASTSRMLLNSRVLRLSESLASSEEDWIVGYSPVSFNDAAPAAGAGVAESGSTVARVVAVTSRVSSWARAMSGFILRLLDDVVGDPFCVVGSTGSLALDITKIGNDATGAGELSFSLAGADEAIVYYLYSSRSYRRGGLVSGVELMVHG